MSDPSLQDAAEIVRQVVRARVSEARFAKDASDDIPIGSAGLGLDSVAIVELLLDCEASLGVPFPAAIFEQGPLTVRRLIDHAAVYARS